ncbi:MAG: hypothetical protein AB8I08_14605 [Sandaracinaceae bacterium]
MSPSTLFGHLSALREAQDAKDPRLAAHWRGVHAWLVSTFPGGGAADDRRQETLMALLRSVSSMRADTPLAAAKWVSTIHKRKRVDALRALSRNPVDVGLASAPRDPELPSPLDRLEAASPAPPREALEAVVTMVLEHVGRVLERDVKNPRKRALRRVQAQAAMLRLVCGWDAEAIAEALDHGEPISRDRLYKWVERGRPPVLAALDDWETLDDADERDALAPVVQALREMFETRRVDAGVPRVDRRGGAS